MTLPALLFPAAAIALLAYFFYLHQRKSHASHVGHWAIPAALSLMFFLFSLYTVATEGPWGFIEEHTRSLWSSQIWLDLLLGVSIAVWWIVPPARAVGMRVGTWLVFVVITGNIGLLAMLARLWWLQSQATKSDGAVESALQKSFQANTHRR